MNNVELIEAVRCMRNAKRELVGTALALQKTGGNFEATIREIKENIGDLEIAIESLEQNDI